MNDVIIVGAGPIGSYIARGLAERGRRVLVLERRPAPGWKAACTGIVSLECAETFGIDDSVILRKANSAVIYSPFGKSLALKREAPQACILDRPAFDRKMAEEARQAGAEYRFSSRVTDVNTHTDRAVVTLSTWEELAARAVVIAAGFAPGLLRRLGLGTFRDFTLGAQAEVDTDSVSQVEVYFGDISPGFFGWLVPAAPCRARVGLLARKDPGRYLRDWLQKLAASSRIASAEAEIHYGGIPLRPLRNTSAERLLVVGDSAGQVKPTSGGGIYYGLLCAGLAVATLEDALARDDLSAKRLFRYDRAWRKLLGRELRTGYWARKLYERLSDRQIDHVFELVKAGGIDEALLKAEDLSFDWHGKTIKRLIKYQVISRAMNIIRLPLKLLD